MQEIIKKKIFDTPILLLLFNREKETKTLFDVIKKIRPPVLYIACDGPRINNEEDLVKIKKVRDIFKNINWECRVETLFRNKNLGCGKAVSSGIDWFFSHEEMGIILEDDCIPSLSFFQFCDQMLLEYQFNQKVFMISGHNKFGTWLRDENDYFFSRVGTIWGWATWKESWSKYDFEMSNLEELIKTNYFESKFNKKSSKIIKSVLLSAKHRIKNKKLDTWDYQFFYTRIINDGICINPSLNLVKNIGFNSDEATHTKNKNKANDEILNYEISFPIRKNKTIKIDTKFDDLLIEKIQNNNVFNKIKSKIRKIWEIF